MFLYPFSIAKISHIQESRRQTKPKKGPKRKIHEFRPFLWIWVFSLRKTSTIHIELLFRNAPGKSSWTGLLWFGLPGWLLTHIQNSDAPTVTSRYVCRIRGTPDGTRDFLVAYSTKTDIKGQFCRDTGRFQNFNVLRGPDTPQNVWFPRKS